MLLVLGVVFAWLLALGVLWALIYAAAEPGPVEGT
jgi:hypothetical protein